MLKLSAANSSVTLQTLGEPQHQHLGISVSGAADEYAYLAGQALVGNQHAGKALEIMFGNATFDVLADCTVAITGANCRPTIDGAQVENWQRLVMTQGQRLSLNFPIKGIYSYLAIANGFECHPDNLSQNIAVGTVLNSSHVQVEPSDDARAIEFNKPEPCLI